MGVLNADRIDGAQRLGVSSGKVEVLVLTLAGRAGSSGFRNTTAAAPSPPAATTTSPRTCSTGTSSATCSGFICDVSTLPPVWSRR